jgi:hypothetical protein
MYFRLLFALIFALCLAGAASAQNTAEPVITGYLSTVDCPSTALTPCFVQYGAGGGGGGSVTQGTVPWVESPAALTPVATSQMGLTVATATALTVPATATTAVITVEGNSVRYRDDGTAPTASVGTLIPVGAVMTLKLTSFTNAQFIQTAATANIDVAYYK